MKRFFILWMVLTIGSVSGYSQVVKLINGAVLSWLNDKNDVYEKSQGFYTGGIGVDYLEHDYFYLSSELVYKPRGGKALLLIPHTSGPLADEYVAGRADYLHFNTTARFKYEISDLNVYVGVGPKIDILLGSHPDADKIVEGVGPEIPLLYKDDLKSVVWGIKPEVGVFYDIDPFRFDLNFSWLVDFSRIGKNKTNDLRAGAFSAALGIGYRF